jgi:hypothetical protein
MKFRRLEDVRIAQSNRGVSERRFARPSIHTPSRAPLRVALRDACYSLSTAHILVAARGCSSMAELQLPKLIARVRFPSSALLSPRLPLPIPLPLHLKVGRGIASCAPWNGARPCLAHNSGTVAATSGFAAQPTQRRGTYNPAAPPRRPHNSVRGIHDRQQKHHDNHDRRHHSRFEIVVDGIGDGCPQLRLDVGPLCAWHTSHGLRSKAVGESRAGGGRSAGGSLGVVVGNTAAGSNAVGRVVAG